MPRGGTGPKEEEARKLHASQKPSSSLSLAAICVGTQRAGWGGGGAAGSPCSLPGILHRSLAGGPSAVIPHLGWTGETPERPASPISFSRSGAGVRELVALSSSCLRCASSSFSWAEP